ncbi:hypothetical protein FRC12_011628 [Ceratobasidium sp. 428]|nr:hypothetical protein FRC12_011628 [Ceratobasidium sp. 428]
MSDNPVYDFPVVTALALGEDTNGPFSPSAVASGLQVPISPTRKDTFNPASGGRNPKGQGAAKVTAQENPKRKLIVCIDGTSNQFSEKNTNVVELYSRIKKDENQLTYYNSGIGTYAKPSWRSYNYLKQVLSNTVDLAIAWFVILVLFRNLFIQRMFQEF